MPSKNFIKLINFSHYTILSLHWAAFLTRHPPLAHYRVVWLCDSQLASIYGPFLPAAHRLLTFPAGEASKTRSCKARLEDQLLQDAYSRDTLLIALGGGVTLDLGACLASTYHRGIPFVSVPSSLLAMVDACWGNKNALNTPYGKNSIGSFYAPIERWILPSLLTTLPSAQWAYGLAEIIKHGLLSSEAFLQALFVQKKRIHTLAPRSKAPAAHWLCKTLETDPLWMQKMIRLNLLFKDAFIQQDPQDHGTRQCLNLGHTFGHAIEQLLHYRLAHGHAVAIGLWMEAYLSTLCSGLPLDDWRRIQHYLSMIDLRLILPSLQKIPLSDWFSALRSDKKNGRFALLKKIGQPMIGRPSLAQIQKTILWYQKKTSMDV